MLGFPQVNIMDALSPLAPKDVLMVHVYMSNDADRILS